MLTKIIFTILVIAMVVLFTRASKRTRSVSLLPDKPLPAGKRWIKILAILVVSLMLVTSSVFIYMEWRSVNEVLLVQVIDSRSGRITEYRVARGKLEDRAFQTQDGRYVRLAETERMEIGAGN